MARRSTLPNHKLLRKFVNTRKHVLRGDITTTSCKVIFLASLTYVSSSIRIHPPNFVRTWWYRSLSRFSATKFCFTTRWMDVYWHNNTCSLVSLSVFGLKDFDNFFLSSLSLIPVFGRSLIFFQLPLPITLQDARRS